MIHQRWLTCEVILKSNQSSAKFKYFANVEKMQSVVIFPIANIKDNKNFRLIFDAIKNSYSLIMAGWSSCVCTHTREFTFLFDLVEKIIICFRFVCVCCSYLEICAKTHFFKLVLVHFIFVNSEMCVYSTKYIFIWHLFIFFYNIFYLIILYQTVFCLFLFQITFMLNGSYNAICCKRQISKEKQEWIIWRILIHWINEWIKQKIYQWMEYERYLSSFRSVCTFRNEFGNVKTNWKHFAWINE